MAENPEGNEAGRAAFRQKTAEIAVAGFLLALGLLVIYDSVRLGAKWAEDGPQPGYFPFYLGLILSVVSAANLLFAVLGRRKGADKPFVQVDQLKAVLAVLVPAGIFAAAVGWIGLYASAAIFIAFFMRWLGKYVWWKVLATSLGTVTVIFLIFEKWFLVPLPKGPIEALLGLG